MELRQRYFQRRALRRAMARQGTDAEKHKDRSRVGVRCEKRACRGAALPQLRRADRIHQGRVHRVRRLRGHLSDGLHQFHAERRRGGVAHASVRAGAESDAGVVCVRYIEDGQGDDQGRRRLPALRTVRRALPDRRLGHAQVSARDDACGSGMSQAREEGGGVTESNKIGIEATNDFVVKFANVNGSGSASANELFAKSILRMGVPVSPRNIFPSNIQGLPTWYEVRVTERGWLGRRGGIDLMVAMNPQTWDADIAEIEPGGYLFYDNTRPLPKSKFRDDIGIIGVPLTE